MRFTFLLILLLIVKTALSQNQEFDINLLSKDLTHENQNFQSKTNEKKFKAIISFPFHQALTFYQKNISVQISSSCLFEPSCSRFSRNAIFEYGILKGIFLTADRLMRCNSNGAKGIPNIFVLKNGKIDDKASHYHVH